MNGSQPAVADVQVVAGTGIEVIAPGVATTVQDLRGRRGYWSVGVPPSGAWDDRSLGLANIAVGNAADAAGLEAVLRGPKLRLHRDAVVCLTGAARNARLDGAPVPLGVPITLAAGSVLDMGPLGGPGLRGYLAVRGGIDVPAVLGSRATFLLGGFGGVDGRALRARDQLPIGDSVATAPRDVSAALPHLSTEWEVRVVVGPHGAPEYFTTEGVDEFFATAWRLDHRSDRTGVRLVGPTPLFARADGGDAGLHPSNIHDSPYPVGGVMVSGGTPVIVGPDGPSLGGFVVPAVVISADRWKLAQCRPGDTVRLVPVTAEQADAARLDRARLLDGELSGVDTLVTRTAGPAIANRPKTLACVAESADRPELVVRRAGDEHLLVEAGEPRLDLAVRLRIHLLAQAIAERGSGGITECVEGVRSLLLGADPSVRSLAALAQDVADAWLTTPALESVELSVREVSMPISFDDPSVHDAMTRYAQRVRPDAPWCPDNVEFIRRVNGLQRRDDVFDLVQAATYLVVGLGDVYLGAPVAVPLDPRHRLVTTKYDPPRTWTPENAVGIGGVYLCVYGMEGPGGYQLVGRTVPVWRNPSATPAGQTPWLLRPFDLLRFEPVSADRLMELRADIAAGRAVMRTRPATLRLADLVGVADDTGFTQQRQAAFAAERERWAATAASAPASAAAGGSDAAAAPTAAVTAPAVLSEATVA